MSLRKIRRRSLRLQYRGEVFQTFDLLTGEYAGTYFAWNPTRERTPGVSELDGEAGLPRDADGGGKPA